MGSPKQYMESISFKKLPESAYIAHIKIDWQNLEEEADMISNPSDQLWVVH